MHSKTLLQILKPLAPAVGNKMLPACDYVNIKSGLATTSNLELSITNLCDLPDMILPYRELIDILNKSNGELIFGITAAQIEIEINEGGKRNSKYKLGKPIDANTFPVVNLIDDDGINVDADFFFSIEQAAKNESINDARLTGFFIGENDIIGCDNYGAYKQTIQSGISAHSPALLGQVTKGWQEGLLKTDCNHLSISQDGLTVNVLLSAQPSPDFNFIFPATIEPNISINRALLESALKKCQTFDGFAIISMKMEPGSIELSYSNSRNEETFIPLEVEHNLKMELNFNAAIFLRVLSCLPYDCTELQMCFQSETQAVFIIYNNITLLIMPREK